MRRICTQLYGFDLQAAWLLCDIDGKNYFDWSFLERRQLFFELMAYHLEQKNIKIGQKVSFGKEAYDWDESTSIADTIIYFEKGFCKNEELFNGIGTEAIEKVFTGVNTNSTTWFSAVVDDPVENFEMDMYTYFYDYCPNVAYWHEKSRSWIWAL
jgi:hypothetical protein